MDTRLDFQERAIKLIEAESGQRLLSAYQATGAVYSELVIEMYVCEINRLILHENQLYLFKVDPACENCRQYTGKVEVKLQIQTSGPRCEKCGAFTTYARVDLHGMCMKCENENKA